MADEIIITNEGRVEQMGDPVEIYLHPKTPFVAQFIGKSSIIEEYGKLKGFDSIYRYESDHPTGIRRDQESGKI